MRTEDYFYTLPKKLIAQFPSEKRGDSRLLVLNRKTQKIEHKKFCDINDYLENGDALVLNETKVIPARLIGYKDTGGKVEVFLLQELKPDKWKVIISPHRARQSGVKVNFGTDLKGKIEIVNGTAYCFFYSYPENLAPVNYISPQLHNRNTKQQLYVLLEKHGNVPLPPYIKRQPSIEDKERYQTIYARTPGACAAPTAGLHFTQEILDKLSNKGVNITKILLHTGIGSFKPIKCSEIESHNMAPEYYEISMKSAQKISSSNKTIAVGTSTVRALESSTINRHIPTTAQPQHRSTATPHKHITTNSGWTDKFIYPPYKFKFVDAMITNFHLPCSTLLLLVAAFAGRETIMKAYNSAIQKGYRFYSYGDAMLIL